MVRIACIFDKGSRFPLIIAEGLLNHPDVDVCFNKAVCSLGRVLAPAVSPESLGNVLVKCDLIFLPDLEHLGQIRILRLIDRHNLWRKVVVYDFKDSPVVDGELFKRCLAYFKRSYCFGPERNFLPDYGKPILPLNYCVLEAYLEIASLNGGERPIDIGYYFNPATVSRDKRRGGVLECLREEDWYMFSTMIGKTTTDRTEGRRSILYAPEGNPWVEYMQDLWRTKILFSAFPDAWDGDSRTWEAMASQALCFLDRTYIPTDHYFEHGRHCFFFDAADKASIRDAIQLAKQYLRPEKKGERERIAREGYTHAVRFHRSVHRVDYMLRAIQAL